MGKRVFILGGSGLLGSAIGRELREHGSDIFFSWYADEARALSLAGELDCRTSRCDVTDPASVEAAVASEMMRLVAVMKLMVRGTDEPLAPARTEREPHRGMPEDADQVEREDQGVESQKLVEANGRRGELVEGPGRQPGHDHRDPRHH